MIENTSSIQIPILKGGGSPSGMGESLQVDQSSGLLSFSVKGLFYNGAGNGELGKGYVAPTSGGVSRRTDLGTPSYDDNTDTFLLDQAILVPVLQSNQKAQLIQKGDLQDVTINGEQWRKAVVYDGGSYPYDVRLYKKMEEKDFSQIQYWSWNTDDHDPAYPSSFWRVIGPDNTTRIFGNSKYSRVSVLSGPEESEGPIFKWLPVETFDALGHSTIIKYKPENTENIDIDCSPEKDHVQTGKRYVHSQCSGHAQPLPEPLSYVAEPYTHEPDWFFETIYDYGEYDIDPSNLNPYLPVRTWAARQDPFSTYLPGFEVRCHRLVQNILRFKRFDELGPNPVLNEVLSLNYDQLPAVSLLTLVEQLNYYFRDGKYEVLADPPLEMDYISFNKEMDKTKYRKIIHGDSGKSISNIGPGAFVPIDLYSEGVEGLLYSDGLQGYYLRTTYDSVEDEAAPVRFTSEHTSIPLPQGGLKMDAFNQFMDLDGNGKLDYIFEQSGMVGYYPAKGNNKWGNYLPMKGVPNEMYHTGMRQVDVTGDGILDLIIKLPGNKLRYYPNTGKGGFGQGIEVIQPQIPDSFTSSQTELLVFSNIGGDGKASITKINQGGLTYWPNYGYGKFGNPIQMSGFPNIPKSDFRIDRIFLRPICGTGFDDLVHFSEGKITVYPNESGNSFGQPFDIPLPEGTQYDPLDTILFADVLGTGTPGMIYSQSHPVSKQWLYYFNDSEKPYLISGFNNNLGGETQLSYRGSAQFAMEDSSNGQPWNTNVPFSLQVVDQVVNFDFISAYTETISYRYRDAYFNPYERHMGGFGFAESISGTLFDKERQHLNSSAVKTKTWFLTGNVDQAALTRIYEEKEYFKESESNNLAVHLPPSVIEPGTLNPGADIGWQAALLLRGEVLHSEVYGLDGSSDQNYPYTTSESNHTIKVLQPKGSNQYASLIRLNRESLDYNYERNPQDPAMMQSVSLFFDDYGNEVQNASFSYARREGYQDEEDTTNQQKKIRCTSNIYRFLNLTDAATDIGEEHASDQLWLLGVPAENENFNINNAESIGTLADGAIYSYQQIKDFLCTSDPAQGIPFSPEVIYELFGWGQTEYTYPVGGDAGSIQSDTPDVYTLGLERVGSKGLLLNKYGQQAAFDKSELYNMLKGFFTEDELNDQMSQVGKYKDQDNLWWVPQSQNTYNDADKFYLPKGVSNPMGNTSLIEYDTYNLLEVLITDPAGNTSSADQIDYQLISAIRIKDINNNSIEIIADARKRVVATSFFGGETIDQTYLPDSGFYSLYGDDTHSMPYAVQPHANLDTMLGNPFDYLQNAQSFYAYDPFNWMGVTSRGHYWQGENGLSESQIEDWFKALTQDRWVNINGALYGKFRQIVNSCADVSDLMAAVGLNSSSHKVLTTLSENLRPYLFEGLQQAAGLQPAYALKFSGKDYPDRSNAQLYKDDYIFYVSGIDEDQLESWWNEQLVHLLITVEGVFDGSYRQIIQNSDDTAAFVSALGEISSNLQWAFLAFPSDQQEEIFALLTQAIELRIGEQITYYDGKSRAVVLSAKAENGSDCLLYNKDLNEVSRNLNGALQTDRWLTQTHIVYDGSDRYVRQYSPYYINTARYVSDSALYRTGSSPNLYYDVLNRNITTMTNRGFLELLKITPWGQVRSDGVDTFLISPFYQVNKENIYDLTDGSDEAEDTSSIYLDFSMSDNDRLVYRQIAARAWSPSSIIQDNRGLNLCSIAINVGEIYLGDLSTALGYDDQKTLLLLQDLVDNTYCIVRESYKLVQVPPENPVTSEPVPVYWWELAEGFPFSPMVESISLGLPFDGDLSMIIGLLYQTKLSGGSLAKDQINQALIEIYGRTPFDDNQGEAVWVALNDSGYIDNDGSVGSGVVLPILNNLNENFLPDSDKILTFLTLVWAGGALRKTYYVNDSIGRQVSVADPRLYENDAFTTVYSFAGSVDFGGVIEDNCDAGIAYRLDNANGQNMWRREARGIEIATEYDELNRSVASFASLVDAGENVPIWGPLAFQRAQYGESVYYDESGEDALLDAQKRNYRGRVVQTFGQGGWNANPGYDLIGNMLGSEMKVAKAYKPQDSTYAVAPPLVVAPATFSSDPSSPNDPDDLLQSTSYYDYNYYDAQGNTIQHVDSLGGNTVYINQQGGGTKHMVVDGVKYIKNSLYNALGLQTEFESHNSDDALVVKTFFRYDMLDYRLRQIYSTKDPSELQDTYDQFKVIEVKDDNTRQSLVYSNDSIGNIGAQDVLYQAPLPSEIGPEVMKVFEPSGKYRYDALSQLIAADIDEESKKPGCLGRLCKFPVISLICRLIKKFFG